MSIFGADVPAVVGNWKCNGTPKFAREWAKTFAESVPARLDVAAGVCPPAVLAFLLRELLPDQVAVGAQDASAHGEGAHTGEASAGMLAAAGCSFSIVGHSERRAMGDGDEAVRAKLHAALAAGLGALLCVGETAEERARGETNRVVRRQLQSALGGEFPGMRGNARLAVGYEPVWAIGSGRTPAPEEIEGAHRAIAETLGDISGERVKIPVLYGGSVSEGNASEIIRLPEVDGVLVGGASLDPVKFARICALSAGKRNE